MYLSAYNTRVRTFAREIGGRPNATDQPGEVDLYIKNKRNSFRSKNHPQLAWKTRASRATFSTKQAIRRFRLSYYGPWYPRKVYTFRGYQRGVRVRHGQSSYNPLPNAASIYSMSSLTTAANRGNFVAALYANAIARWGGKFKIRVTSAIVFARSESQSGARRAILMFPVVISFAFSKPSALRALAKNGHVLTRCVSISFQDGGRNFLPHCVIC